MKKLKKLEKNVGDLRHRSAPIAQKVLDFLKSHPEQEFSAREIGAAISIPFQSARQTYRPLSNFGVKMKVYQTPGKSRAALITLMYVPDERDRPEQEIDRPERGETYMAYKLHQFKERIGSEIGQLHREIDEGSLKFATTSGIEISISWKHREEVGPRSSEQKS